MKTYVILGATGHTGKPVAIGLLEKGHAVRIVSRDPAKAADLIAKGAKHFASALTDTPGLKKAFDGADAAYVMVPGDVQSKDASANQAAIVEAVAEALTGSSVRKVVTLSSIGAHLKQGAGIVQGLQKMEERFNTIAGIDFLHLRATYFLENTIPQAGLIKQMGIMGSPVAPEIKLPMVATSDIAAFALRVLLALDFKGKGHEYVLGSRDYTYPEIAAIYGKAIGKPELKYVQFPYEDAKKAMMQMGLGESYTDKLIEFTRMINAGKVTEDYRRSASNTTHTSAEEFAHVFKAIYEQA